MKVYATNDIVNPWVDGEWVNAEVAQEMYDALTLAYEILAQEQFYTSARKALNALQRADEGK